MGLFDFGKKRRHRSKRTVKRSKKHGSRKPPARLLRICKKYRVKATKKVGKHRVYKSIAMLKKLCLRKARALKKKLMKMHKKSKKHSKRSGHRKSHRRTHRRSRFGEDEELDNMMFGRRRSRFGGEYEPEEMMFGARRRRFGFGAAPVAKAAMVIKRTTPPGMKTASRVGVPKPTVRLNCTTGFGRSRVPMFGKKRRSGGRRVSHKRSKAAAMKAFRSFYKRHCAGARRSHFGNGGNPQLSESMGYEFCPNGQGGVLGFNSTGLFPSPCTSLNKNAASAEMARKLPSYSSVGLGKAATTATLPRTGMKFGRVRRRRSTMVGAKRRSAIGYKRRSVKRRSTASGVRRPRRSTAIGARRRRSAIGYKRRSVKRRSTAAGVRRRRSAVGSRRR
jgi:hypothetical protein